MTETLIEIEGLDDACAMLDASTRNIAGRGMLRGLQAAAAVVVAELQIRTPVQTELGQDREPGTLLAALTTDIELDSQSRGGSVDIGYGNEGYIANFVEYGHDQVARGGGRDQVKKGGTATGFTPSHPFMRPAADATGERSIEAFRDALLESLASDSKVNTEEAA